MVATIGLDPFNARNVAERLAESQQICKAFGAGNFDTELLLQQSTQCMLGLLEPHDGLLLDAQKQMFAEQVEAQRNAAALGQSDIPVIPIEVAEPLLPERPKVLDGELVTGEHPLEDLLPAGYASNFSSPGGKVDEAVALQADAQRDAAVKERILAAETGPGADNAPPLVAGNDNARGDIAHDKNPVIAQEDLDSQINRPDGHAHPEAEQAVAVRDGKSEQKAVVAHQTAVASEKNLSEHTAKVASLETALKGEEETVIARQPASAAEQHRPGHEPAAAKQEIALKGELPAVEVTRAPEEPQKLAGLTTGIAIDLGSISPQGVDREHDGAIAPHAKSTTIVETAKTEMGSLQAALAQADGIRSQMAASGLIVGLSDARTADLGEQAKPMTVDPNTVQAEFRQSLESTNAIA